MLIIAAGQKADRDIFSIFFSIKVCCVFALESPHRGESNENTRYTIFIIKKSPITQNYPKSSVIGFFSKGLKNEFETVVVNKPSGFEPLKFYYMNNESVKKYNPL